MLILGFNLNGHVPYAVLCKLVANFPFHSNQIADCDHMQGSAVPLSVHTPNMDVMDILHSLYLAKVRFDLLRMDAARHFFQKNFQNFLKPFPGVQEYPHRHANGHEGIDECPIGISHNYRADQNNTPTEHILQHMQIDCPLI